MSESARAGRNESRLDDSRGRVEPNVAVAGQQAGIVVDDRGRQGSLSTSGQAGHVASMRADTRKVDAGRGRPTSAKDAPRGRKVNLAPLLRPACHKRPA